MGHWCPTSSDLRTSSIRRGPWPLAKLRRQAGQLAGGSQGGKCLITTLAIELYDKGPGLELRRRVVSEWLASWQVNPSIHQRVSMV
eukprot:4423731-Pyramimonas_sp.AAC.2